MISMGFGIGASAVVGISIGENNVPKAKKYAKLTIIVSVIVNLTA